MLTLLTATARRHLLTLLCLAGLGLGNPLLRVALGQVDSGALDSRLSLRLHWVQFTVSGGGITGRTSYLDTNMSATTTDGAGHRESMSLDVSSGVPAVQYRLITPTERLEIDVSGGDRVLIVRSLARGKGRVEYKQAPGQRISFSVHANGQTRVYRTTSIWLLILEAPADCRQHLLPVLELLRPGWNLLSQAQTIEHLLLRAASSGKQRDHKQWARWVDDLGNPQFARRQAAERNLVAAGPAVRPFLARLDRSKLDLEQLSRIRRIMNAMGQAREDTAERTADSLLADPAVWLALFARDDAPHRRIAAKQLARLLSRPVELDADAPPEVRKVQAQALRREIERERSKGG